MPTLLVPYMIRFAPWILVALLVIGSVIYGRHLQDQLQIARQDVAAAQGTIDQLTATNQQNLATLKRLEAENAVWQTTLTTTIATDNRISQFTSGLLSAIAGAPAKDDAPVAPVLATTLAAISKQQGNVP